VKALPFAFTRPVRELNRSRDEAWSLGPRTETNDRATTAFLLPDLCLRRKGYF
jgi:hypothetical protein